MAITKHKELYKKDSNQNTRVWWIESEENKYRMHSGVLDGQIVVSEWTTCEGKNIGKKNESSPSEQCLLEVAASYKKKLAQGNYKDSLDEESLEKDNYIKPMLAKEYGEDYTCVEKDFSQNIVFSQSKYDGCFSYDTLITCADGKEIEIGKIVENRLCVNVLSVNIETMQIEEKEILSFMSFDESEEWVELEFENGTKIRTTINHQFWSESRKDWVPVKDLKLNEDCLLLDI